MKQGKLLAIVFLVLAFVVFFMTRPVREKACPLAQKSLANDPELVKKCSDLGGVLKDGGCTCPE